MGVLSVLSHQDSTCGAKYHESLGKRHSSGSAGGSPPCFMIHHHGLVGVVSVDDFSFSIIPGAYFLDGATLPTNQISELHTASLPQNDTSRLPTIFSISCIRIFDM